MKKPLVEARLEEMIGKRFEVVRVILRLCELCSEEIDIQEQLLKIVEISDRRGYENLLTRSKVYDRAEVDVQEGRIYFYDHDYPGDVHQRCLEKL